MDFLFSGETASDAILIEIKTLVTRLVQKRSHRGNVYAPSAELTGSVVQVADYRRSLTRELAAGDLSGFPGRERQASRAMA